MIPISGDNLLQPIGIARAVFIDRHNSLQAIFVEIVEDRKGRGIGAEVEKTINGVCIHGAMKLDVRNVPFREFLPPACDVVGRSH